MDEGVITQADSLISLRFQHNSPTVIEPTCAEEEGLDMIFMRERTEANVYEINPLCFFKT